MVQKKVLSMFSQEFVREFFLYLNLIDGTLFLVSWKNVNLPPPPARQHFLKKINSSKGWFKKKLSTQAKILEKIIVQVGCIEYRIYFYNFLNIWYKILT
jgi:glutaredoxin 2